MDWTEILRAAGIPDAPGRDEAIAAAGIKTAERYVKTGGEPPRAKSSNTKKSATVSRKSIQQREAKAAG